MQRRVSQTHRTRSHTPNSYGKRVTVGNTAGTVPPAWRAATAAQSVSKSSSSSSAGLLVPGRTLQKQSQASAGSKIVLSQFPPDTVTEGDIEELLTSQIGPVFDCYVVHNSQGRSKGVAIVHFQRPGDALEARRMFNGKIIDGRRPLKIELIVDPPPGVLVKKKEKEKSLAERLSAPGVIHSGTMPHAQTQTQTQEPAPPLRPINPRRLTARVRARSHRQTIKRGPRRPNKSAFELDQEMETYMSARTPPFKSAANS